MFGGKLLQMDLFCVLSIARPRSRCRVCVDAHPPLLLRHLSLSPRRKAECARTPAKVEPVVDISRKKAAFLPPEPPPHAPPRHYCCAPFSIFFSLYYTGEGRRRGERKAPPGARQLRPIGQAGQGPEHRQRLQGGRAQGTSSTYVVVGSDSSQSVGFNGRSTPRGVVSLDVAVVVVVVVVVMVVMVVVIRCLRGLVFSRCGGGRGGDEAFACC